MDPANASLRDRQSALRCDPLVPRPNNVVPGLHANAEWPDYIDIVRPTQLFVLPGPHPGTFSMPGQARYRFIFDRQPETNLHAGASYIKYLADMLVRALDFSVTRLCNSWESDTSRADRPSIAYSIYHDDLITHALIDQLAANRIPALCVISDDPKRNYFAGGISYQYDEASGVYTGTSLGRPDIHSYRASEFAKYYTYHTANYSMTTLAHFCGQRLVLFYANARGDTESVPR